MVIKANGNITVRYRSAPDKPAIDCDMAYIRQTHVPESPRITSWDEKEQNFHSLSAKPKVIGKRYTIHLKNYNIICNSPDVAEKLFLVFLGEFEGKVLSELIPEIFL